MHKIDFSKYINLPYKHKGRDFNGVDCYGIAYLIYKTETDIFTPDFLDVDYEEKWYTKDQNHIVNNMGLLDLTQWDVVTPPYKVLDGLILFLASKRIANHCALYIGNDKIIHIYEEHKSMIERLDSYRSKIYCAIRHKRMQ